jgi:hypothetical protein
LGREDVASGKLVTKRNGLPILEMDVDLLDGISDLKIEKDPMESVSGVKIAENQHLLLHTIFDGVNCEGVKALP